MGGSVRERVFSHQEQVPPLTSSWADSCEDQPVVTHLLLPLPVRSCLQFLLCQELARRVEQARGLCAHVLLRPIGRCGQRDV